MIALARLLTYVSIPVVVVSLGKVHADMNDYSYTGTSRFGFSMTLIAVMWIAVYAVGLPELAESQLSALSAAVKATLVAALTVSAVQLFIGDSLLTRFVVFGSSLILIPWLWICALIASRGSSTAAGRDKVFAIATAENSTALAEDLQRNPERPARIVGTLEPIAALQAQQDNTLEIQIKEAGATVLVLDRDAFLADDIVSQAGFMHQGGLRVRTLLKFYEQWLGKLPITELERASLMFDISELHRARYGRIKRVVDVFAVSIGSVVLVILLPFLYIGTLLSGHEKLLYKQRRVGKGGTEFWMYKFTTMKPSVDEKEDRWTTLDDPRITRFGRILRRSHIDELPQMVNILKGELTLFGPRPEQPSYVRSLTEALPYYMFRYSVTPGLTGWAQVKFGYAGTDAEALEKLQYDLYYLANQGLRLDLHIAGRTLRNIVGLRGR
jgi:lipopolysaccharide/colanic/teichoic acid biosynthesis glycosyltransferase